MIFTLHNNMNMCIVYLASPILSLEPTQSGLSRFDVLKISLHSVQKYLPGFPILIFHEDYSQKQFEELSLITTNISFEKISFFGHDEHFVYRKRQKNYLMMCRFFCGPLQSHPALSQYDSYLRLDDDSFLIPPIMENKNIFEKYDYAYRSVFVENHDQSTLFHFTKSFLEKKKLVVDQEQLKKIGLLNNKNYTGMAPYNNFHFSKLSMWKHPLIQEYIKTIEEKHCILKYMWLDANIHSMIIFLLAPFCDLNIGCITTFGYRHNRHFSKIGSPEIKYEANASFCP